MSDEKRCNCRTCEYGKKIMALVARQATPEDKKMVEDLYESFCLKEDDNCLLRGRWRAAKPILCAIRKDHFLTRGGFRLDGHETCVMCEMLEKV